MVQPGGETFAYFFSRQELLSLSAAEPSQLSEYAVPMMAAHCARKNGHASSKQQSGRQLMPTDTGSPQAMGGNGGRVL